MMDFQRDLFGDMITTYTTADIGIGGMNYVPHFLNAHDESLLLNEVDRHSWRNDLKRRVQHYGFRYDYKARKVDKSMYLGPLPEFGAAIAHRLLSEGYLGVLPDQLIVNEYVRGQGISAHIDCEPCFGESIAMVSLGWAYEMDFRRESECQSILLERGSLLIICGEARHDWMHEIKPRKSDKGIRRERRVSLTFRKVCLENELSGNE